jgi:hypothetical protein
MPTTTETITKILSSKKNISAMKKLGMEQVVVDRTSDPIYTVTTCHHLIFKFTYKDAPVSFVVPYGTSLGCCGIGIVHEIFITPRYGMGAGETTGHGFGGFLFPIVCEAMRSLSEGYCFGGLLIATTIPSQVAGIKLLERSGWKPTGRFRNPNTNEIITMWELRLRSEEYDRVGRYPQYSLQGANI